MKTMIQAGKLRHRITFIQAAGSGTDPDGQPIEDWTNPETVATVWGSKQQLQGREFFEGRAELGKDVFRFRVRYQAALNDRRLRLQCNGETYKIESPDDIESRNKELVIVATKLEAGG